MILIISVTNIYWYQSISGFTILPKQYISVNRDVLIWWSKKKPDCAQWSASYYPTVGHKNLKKALYTANKRKDKVSKSPILINLICWYRAFRVAFLLLLAVYMFFFKVLTSYCMKEILHQGVYFLNMVSNKC